jgi:hypothetical protein
MWWMSWLGPTIGGEGQVELGIHQTEDGGSQQVGPVSVTSKDLVLGLGRMGHFFSLLNLECE